ncbi:hypothetical protein J6590_037461 [Homalodisca vitripennis]|nr:hypothetical protein J6590_037461 [Homalodisca vitripennis]
MEISRVQYDDRYPAEYDDQYSVLEVPYLFMRVDCKAVAVSRIQTPVLHLL